MNNTVIKDNAIIFSRYGEVVRITACYNNSIRFEAFPEGRIYNENLLLKTLLCNQFFLLHLTAAFAITSVSRVERGLHV